MSTVITASALNVRNALAAARRLAGVSLAESREVIRSGGEDGLHRVTLANGLVVEVSCVPGARAEACWLC